MVTTPSNTAVAIFEAASRLMLEQGDGGLRVDAVAAAAGCNKRLIYHYFGNRDRLVGAVYQQQCWVLRSAENGLSQSTRLFLDQQLQRAWPQSESSAPPGAQWVVEKSDGADLRQAMRRALVLVVPHLLRRIAAQQVDLAATEFSHDVWQKVSAELISALFVVEELETDTATDPVSKHSQTSKKPRYRMSSASRRIE